MEGREGGGVAWLREKKMSLRRGNLINRIESHRAWKARDGTARTGTGVEKQRDRLVSWRAYPSLISLKTIVEDVRHPSIIFKSQTSQDEAVRRTFVEKYPSLGLVWLEFNSIASLGEWESDGWEWGVKVITLPLRWVNLPWIREFVFLEWWKSFIHDDRVTVKCFPPFTNGNDWIVQLFWFHFIYFH
jgi:hypothetical protein